MIFSLMKANQTHEPYVRGKSHRAQQRASPRRGLTFAEGARARLVSLLQKNLLHSVLKLFSVAGSTSDRLGKCLRLTEAVSFY